MSRTSILDKNVEAVRIGPKHQITIPGEIFKRLNLEPGDFLGIQMFDKGVLMVPQKLIRKDQLWFWSKEWQKKEREAGEAISRGEISGPFGTAKELIRHLKNQKNED